MSAGDAPTPHVTLATLNLYHWAEPSIGWYAPDARHTAEGWAVKQAWLRAILAEMDADFVGFQEVVSVDGLRALCAEAGYPHFAVADQPRIAETEEGARFYTRPVQAAASRHPMETAPLAADPAVAGALGLAPDRDFRRPPLWARVDIPGVGPITAMVCHLKSPGVSEDDAPLPEAFRGPADGTEDAMRARLEGLSRAHAYAGIQRVFEASALHRAALGLIAEGHGPVAVLGDLNDTLGSPPLSALTPRRAGERDGGAPAAGGPSANAASDARFLLADAAALDTRRPFPGAEGRRRPTHRHGASGAAIDFILISEALWPRTTPLGAQTVRELLVNVADDHFIAGRPDESSDHAGVAARFIFGAGR
ncbi:MAG: endonuclease/exonuclease/phosphatase family protein [Pseudomonadota bacterium]